MNYTFSVITVLKDPISVCETNVGDDPYLAEGLVKLVRKHSLAYVIVHSDTERCIYGIKGHIKKLVLNYPENKWVRFHNDDELLDTVRRIVYGKPCNKMFVGFTRPPR
jgi:hypothetical protein